MLYQAESCPAAADILAYDRTYIHARSGFLPVIIGFLRRVPVVNTIFYIPVVNRVSVCAISHGASRHALSSLPCWQIMTINSRLRHLSLSWGLLAFDPCAAHLPIRSWQTVSTLAGCPYREICHVSASGSLTYFSALANEQCGTATMSFGALLLPCRHDVIEGLFISTQTPAATPTLPRWRRLGNAMPRSCDGDASVSLSAALQSL